MISKEVSQIVYEARRTIRNGNPATYRVDKILGRAVDKNGNKSRFNIEKYSPLLKTDFIVGSNCCNVMKKSPAHKFEKTSGFSPITGQMAEESRLRAQAWLKNGCNAFEAKHQISNPLSFWTEQDVLEYIQRYGVPISSVYGDIVFADDPDQMRIEGSCGKLCTTGCNRTGCIFCGFGAHLERGETRFQLLARTHPKQYAYCIGGGEYDESGMWVPNKKGLGMGHVFDELNRIYGDDFIRYKPEKEHPNEK